MREREPEWIGKPHAETGAERQARYASWLQVLLTIIGMSITLATGLFTYIVANNTRMALLEMRVSGVEDKDKGYDALVLQRSKQWEEIAGRLGRMEANQETLKEMLKERERK